VINSKTPTPAEVADGIVEAHIPERSKISRLALSDAIRWAIIQGQNEARQPLGLSGEHIPAIVRQFVGFTDDYCARLHGAGYDKAANALEACRARVLAIHGMANAERKPVGRVEKPMSKAARA
jgi:hypothetical protein